MKRPGDTCPDPPGGRAAERLREFERAREPVPAGTAQPKKSTRAGARKARKAPKPVARAKR